MDITAVVLSHLWVVGRVVGTWVVPWVAAVVPVRYLQISNLIYALFLSRGEGSTYLSRAVSMAPGVWGLPLSASVAPRALTSLDKGARGVRQGGRLENELQRRIVQMLKNIYTMYF